MTAQAHPIDPTVYARRWKTLGILSLGLLIIGLDNTILNVALPSLQDQLGAEGSTLQWIGESYLLVFAGLVLTFGAFGDRFGRKLGLQAGTAIFGLASLCVLFVGSAGQLIGVRAVMGLGAALIMPATLSIISNIFPREERGEGDRHLVRHRGPRHRARPARGRPAARVVLLAGDLPRQCPRRCARVLPLRSATCLKAAIRTPVRSTWPGRRSRSSRS